MTLTFCCSCGSSALTQVLDLGPMYMADFIEPGEKRSDPWPLRILQCWGCSLLQVAEPTPRALLLHERYGFKSGINEANRADVQDIARYALEANPDADNFLDIASNDGTLLAAVPERIYRCGVDPLAQFEAEASKHADDIIVDYFDPARFHHGEFDIITSAAMFYELTDPLEFTEGVRSVLSARGVWVIQQNYALDMLNNLVVDNIVHEHVAYWSVRSLQHLLARCGMEICDVTYSPVKGGCMRTLVCHKGARPVNDTVEDALRREYAAGIVHPETWQKWDRRVRYELDETRGYLEGLRDRGDRAFIYGASTRGGTLLQMIGAGPDLTQCAVERDADKVGKIYAAANVPIISEDHMRADPPECLLISPWFFRDVFVTRERAYLDSGGSMVFPLPKFEVVTGI